MFLGLKLRAIVGLRVLLGAGVIVGLRFRLVGGGLLLGLLTLGGVVAGLVVLVMCGVAYGLVRLGRGNLARRRPRTLVRLSLGAIVRGRRCSVSVFACAWVR